MTVTVNLWYSNAIGRIKMYVSGDDALCETELLDISYTDQRRASLCCESRDVKQAAGSTLLLAISTALGMTILPEFLLPVNLPFTG